MNSVETAAASLTDRRHLYFGGLVLAAAALHASDLAELLLLALSSKYYSHVMLIPVVFLYLLFRHRERIFAHVGADPASGGVALGVAAASHLALFLSRGQLNANDALTLAIFSLQLLVLAAFIFVYGTGAARRALFPLAFLIFMAPLPTAVMNATVWALTAGSAEVTEWLVRLSGTPLFRDGYVFSIPGLDFVVAPACSGIRSGLSLMIVALLTAYEFLHSTRARLFLLATIFPIAVFKNGLRITALCLLTIYVDRDYIEGDLHSWGGYPFFILALAFLGLALVAARRLDGAKQGDPGAGARF